MAIAAVHVVLGWLAPVAAQEAEQPDPTVPTVTEPPPPPPTEPPPPTPPPPPTEAPPPETTAPPPPPTEAPPTTAAIVTPPPTAAPPPTPPPTTAPPVTAPVTTTTTTTTTTTIDLPATSIDLLVAGDGSTDSETTTTTRTDTTVHQPGPSDSSLIMMIIAGLVAVALLVALLTWRYWVATRPVLVTAEIGSDADDEGDAPDGAGSEDTELTPAGAAPAPAARRDP